MRAVSELIALLVVIVIVVGAVVGASLILSGILQKQSPKTVDLVVSSGRAYLNGNALTVKVLLVPIGAHPIAITGVEVYKGTTKISASSSSVYSLTTLNPGDNYELIVNLYGISGVSIRNGDSLVVVVYWKDIVTGETSASKGTAIVT